MFQYEILRYIDLGPISIPTYAIFANLAFFGAAYVIIKCALKDKLSLKQAICVLAIAFIGMEIGTKTLYYFGPYTWWHDYTILERITQSLFSGVGRVFYGGGLGALFAIWLYATTTKTKFVGNIISGLQKLSNFCEKNFISFTKQLKWIFLGPAKYLEIGKKLPKKAVVLFFDYFMLSLGIIVFLSRIGCYFAGCCRGTETDVPWAIIRNGVPIHPTQIYSSLNGLVLFFTSLWVFKRFPPGYTALYAMAYYSATRFIIEFFRVAYVFGDRTFSQWVSITIFVAVLVVFSYKIDKDTKAKKQQKTSKHKTKNKN